MEGRSGSVGSRAWPSAFSKVASTFLPPMPFSARRLVRLSGPSWPLASTLLKLRPGYWRPARVAVASTDRSITEGLQALSDFLTNAVLAGTPADEVRRSIGRLALEADVVGEDDFVDLFAVLKGYPWPGRFACTAVDTATAEFVVWQSGSDADLQRAVASSCAVPMVCPPVTIGGRRYMDGGARSPLNADLAQGHDSVVVVSVTVLPSSPEETGAASPGTSGDDFLAGIAGELSTLTSSGSALAVIEPNAGFLELSRWGASLMDVGKAGEAFLMGARQGLQESTRVAAVWGR